MRLPTTATLTHMVEFDSPFVIGEGATLFEAPSGIYAPSVTHDEDHDILIDCLTPAQSQWEPLTGFTSQHGYNGAVLHSSEQIGGGLARHILGIPGTYVAVVVEVESEDEDGIGYDDTPAGWAILRKRD